MSQVTIYMDDDAITLAKNSATAEKISLSRWMTGLVKEKTAVQVNKGWPADFWDMAGAWSESDFPDVAQMRANETPQAPRESF
jgi:hypothetical protein